MSNVQSTIDYWKRHHHLGDEHERVPLDAARVQREITNLQELMHILLHFDNGPLDLDPAPGVIECADDGEIDRFSGDSRVGSFQTETPNGSIVCAEFTDEAVRCLQITPQKAG